MLGASRHILRTDIAGWGEWGGSWTNVALQLAPQYQPNTLASPASVNCIDKARGLGHEDMAQQRKHFWVNTGSSWKPLCSFWERKGNTLEIVGPRAERQDGCSRQSPVCTVGRRVSCRLCQLSRWVNREAQGLQGCWDGHMRERSKNSTFQQWIMTERIWKRD